VHRYAEVAIPHLQSLVGRNEKVLKYLAARLVKDVRQGRSLLVFGSGHSSMFPMELYHRAGGASFVIPVVADYLMPSAGPSVVRVLERTAGVASPILARVEPRPGEMLWLASQSGINAAVVDLALEAKRRGLFTAAFTSVAHSRAVKSRHPSGQRLFEVCDRTVDLGGVAGDAAVPLGESLNAGPLSTLGTVLLAHSILVSACSRLEAQGVRCVYTSVNTPAGEARNQGIEKRARRRDWLLR
jgi:uncharacterized phosphosugar-binding protein